MKRVGFVLLALVLAIGLAWKFAGREHEPTAASSRPQESASLEAQSNPSSLAAPSADVEPERQLAPSERVDAPTATEESDATLEPQLTLVFGRVLPPRGEETFAEAPSCGLYDETGTRRKVECAQDGAFAISGVAAGHYWISAGDGDGAGGCVEFELPPGREQHEVDVPLERDWSVEVRVRSSNGQELGALWSLVVATLEPLGDWFHEPSGSLSNPYGVGSFRPARLGQAESGTDVRGTLLIKVESPVWVHLVYGHRVLARQELSPPQTVIEFVIDPEDAVTKPPTLRGRFFDAETGEPLRSVQVMVASRGVSFPKTDGDGRFEASGFLVPGFCRVSVRGPGYAWDQLVRLEPGVETDLGDIRVERGLSIEGKVTGALGDERERTIRYEALDELSGETLWNGMHTGTRIEANGTFKIGGLMPRRYQLTIDGGGDTAKQRHVVDLRNGSVAGLEYVLQRSSTLSIVLENSVRRLEKVEIHDESGALVMAPKLRPGPPQAFKLAPGSYALKLGDVERPVVLGTEPLLVRLP